jgi:hypothetical protein
MQIEFKKFLDSESVLSKFPLWPSLTFVTVFLGFIGFYTYCGLNVIPFAIPDIKVIFGIGLFNLFFILALFLSHQSMYSDKSTKALLILSLFQFLLNEPKYIAYSVILVVLLYSRGYWEAQFGLKLKSKEEEDPNALSSASLVFEILGWVLAGVLSYFKDVSLFWQFFVIYILLHETNKILIDKSIRYVSLFIGLIIVPVFVTNSFLSKKTFNLVGVYYSNVEIKYKTGNSLKGVIVLKTENEIYFKDSIESKNTRIIDRGDVEIINILTDKKMGKDSITISNENSSSGILVDSLSKANKSKFSQDSTSNKVKNQ